MDFKHLTIIGAGQIGTSTAMTAALKNPNLNITAYDIASDLRNIFYEKLQANGIDESRVAFISNPDTINRPDLVLLATPIGNFPAALKTIAPLIPAGAVITDIGSAKVKPISDIKQAMEETGLTARGVSYVAGHIFNGNENSGPASASMDIFEGKDWFLVPDKTVNGKNFARVAAFVRMMGAKPYEMTAEKHDAIVGTMSHLEHVLMFALMHMPYVQYMLNERAVVDHGNWTARMSRIAKASPDMWRDIFLANREEILVSAKAWREDFVHLMEKTGQGISLTTECDTANAFARDMTNTRSKLTDIVIDPVNARHVTGNQGGFWAFLGGMSLAIVRNVQRVGEMTGIKISPIANKSLKDGMGPVAVDPVSVATLLERYGRQAPGHANDFLVEVNRLLAFIEASDGAAIFTYVTEAAQGRRALDAVFAKPVTQPTGPQLVPPPQP